jgi:hypothetical protein
MQRKVVNIVPRGTDLSLLRIRDEINPATESCTATSPYGEVGHSASFVEWIDFDRRSALTIEYVGTNRKVPGRFREADITKTYGLVRGME